LTSHDWTSTRCLWDDRCTDDLRRWAGGDARRVPFLSADGTVLAVDDLPTGPCPDDPVTHTEWTTRLQDAGRIEAACAAAGIALSDPPRWSAEERAGLRSAPVALTSLRAAATALGELDYLDGPADRAGVRPGGWRPWGPWPSRWPITRHPFWRRLPDLDLLRLGWITPQWLHPLVHQAFFPTGSAALLAGPPVPVTDHAMTVLCAGERHRIQLLDGKLILPHDDDVVGRERAVIALGGRTAYGCVELATRLPGSRFRELPRPLREHYTEFYARIVHGDTEQVLRMLRAGTDPRVGDSHGRTPMHLLYLVDHRQLLPVLLAAGVDLEAPDRASRWTPLELAVANGGSTDLVEALLDAGAEPLFKGLFGRHSRVWPDPRRVRWLLALLDRRGLATRGKALSRRYL